MVLTTLTFDEINSNLNCLTKEKKMKSRFTIKDIYEFNPDHIRVSINLLDYYSRQVEFDFNGYFDEKFKALQDSSKYPLGKIGLCEFDPDLKEVKFIENNFNELISKAYLELVDILCSNYNFKIENLRIDGEIKRKVALGLLSPEEGAELISERQKND